MNEIETARRWLQDFARDNKGSFNERGEVGIGRECVGIIGPSGNYVDYGPYNMETLEPIEGLQFDEVEGVAPEGAYHKHPCLAVLVNDERDHDTATIQLYQWLKELSDFHKLSLAEYKTGAKGAQIMFSGATNWALKLEAAI